MYNTCILLAGGQGLRMGGEIPKQYRKIGSQSIIEYSLNFLERSPQIDDIILVVDFDNLEYGQSYLKPKYNKITRIVAGGSSRCQSVINGLKFVTEKTDKVWIHDGVRPFVSETLMETLAKEATGEDALCPGVLVKDTIRQVAADGRSQGLLPREGLYHIQTPQVFSRASIQSAYEKLCASNRDYGLMTDDMMVYEEMLSMRGKIIEGDYFNIKITTPEDLIYGEQILKTMVYPQ